MFTEDLSVFFDSASGFATAAAWGSEAANVILDMPSEDILGGKSSSEEYTAQLATTAWAGVVRGSSITIGAWAYKVRDISMMGDGATKQLKLTRTGAAAPPTLWYDAAIWSDSSTWND
jgi:hypothetical protein